MEDLVLPLAGRDRRVRDYVVPPVTAGELFDLLARQIPWPTVGQRRAERLVGGPVKPDLLHALMLPLGPIVSEQMRSDGVSRPGYALAATTAMQWHFNGDEAAQEIWTTGKLPTGGGTPTAEELEQYVITRSKSGEPLEYDLPADVKSRLMAPPADERITIDKIWHQPDLIEVDIDALFRVDLSRQGDERSGPWLRKRVETLMLQENSVLAAKIRIDIESARQTREKGAR